MGRVTQRRKVHKIVLDGSPQALEFPVRHREDVLAVEEPLEIRLGNMSFSVTMRTPGNDFDLVAGFLVSEGIIWAPEQLVSLRFCAGEDADGMQTFNVVEAQLRPDVVRPETGRNVFTSSSCGICGTDSIDAVRKSSHYSPAHDPLTVPVETLAALPDALRSAQEVFEVTGHRTAGVRPCIVRARPKGCPRRHPGPRRCQCPLQPGRRARRGQRDDTGRVQPRDQPERVRGPATRSRSGARGRLGATVGQRVLRGVSFIHRLESIGPPSAEEDHIARRPPSYGSPAGPLSA